MRRNGFGDVIRRSNPDSGMTDYEYSALGKVTKVALAEHWGGCQRE